MDVPFPLRLFDSEDEVHVVERHLPHFGQQGTLCFMTFRLLDSMPPSVLERWRHDRLRWLRRHGIDPDCTNWRQQLAMLDVLEQNAFHRMFAERWHDELDRGHGACVLRRPELSRIVKESLLFFDASMVGGGEAGRLEHDGEQGARHLESDGYCDSRHLESDGYCGDHFPSDQPPSASSARQPRYLLTDFVIMPNHVHILGAFKDATQMLSQCESWKRFTARRINAQLETKGRFWQPDAFDHLVRSEEQFLFLRQYIAENPGRAKLREREFVLWSRSLRGWSLGK